MKLKLLTYFPMWFHRYSFNIDISLTKFNQSPNARLQGRCISYQCHELSSARPRPRMLSFFSSFATESESSEREISRLINVTKNDQERTQLPDVNWPAARYARGPSFVLAGVLPQSGPAPEGSNIKH